MIETFLVEGRICVRSEKKVFVGTTPHPVTVTTRIITFLIGNPYKPSFVTVTGWGVDRKYLVVSSASKILQTHSRYRCCEHSRKNAEPQEVMGPSKPSHKGITARLQGELLPAIREGISPRSRVF